MKRWAAVILAICVTIVLLLGIVWFVRRPPRPPEFPVMTPRLAWPEPLGYMTPEVVLAFKHYFPIVYGSGNPAPAPRRVRKSLNMVGGASCAELQDLGTDWVYNWNPATGLACPGIPWLPMIRDRNQLDNLGHKLDDYDGVILTFNEPEYQVCSEGACLSLDELITAWHDMELMLPGKTFTSPAFAYPYTFEYDFHDFVYGYRDRYGTWPDFKIIAVHFYAPHYEGYTLSLAQNWFYYMWSQIESLPDVYRECPVWITETGVHAPDGLDPVHRLFAAEWLEWELNYLEAQGRCEYVNWFGPRQGTYTFTVPLYGNGHLTEAGQVWYNWN